MKALGRRSIASFVKFLLDMSWWMITIGLGLLVVLLLCSAVLELPGDNLTMSLPVAVQLDGPVESVGGDTDAHFEKLQGTLRFPARKGAFLSGSVAVLALMFGYLLWIVTQLRCVFRSLSQGLPFVEANARRIRYVGFALLFGEFARTAVIYLFSYYTSLHFRADGLRFAASGDFSPITLAGALVILVIAEVFQQGARLQEEQSLTI